MGDERGVVPPGAPGGPVPGAAPWPGPSGPVGVGNADRGIERIVVVSPFGRPDVGIALGAARAGALGVCDLGLRPEPARHALAALATRRGERLGVRVQAPCPVGPEHLPPSVRVVVLAEVPSAADVEGWGAGGRQVLVEVHDVAEAEQAVAVGAAGLIARGSESGGRVGEETAFVLLQRLVRQRSMADRRLPVWVAGGIGVHSAAAAVAGGATGVVLDAQVALVRESTLPDAVKAAVAAMDGSETAVVGGHRLLVRPGTAGAGLDPASTPGDIAARLGADDLAVQLLPAGQDAALAAATARRWPTVGAVVAGMRRGIADHLEAARRLRPLGPHAPWAVAHGLRYPIAQGPMTRVSDRAAFAAAVARAGALPFLALALLPGEDARALLEETSAAVGGLPWGVGILGFVPEAVRAAQLEAIRAVRPPVALVAGGRPSQARQLEEDGIATYLHVPSPGLLERFVRDGARRFVFEGRECGGHVGPRSSFVLWEQQVEVLLRLGAGTETSVLFAGGIASGPAAAMVGALAAPLAERGVRVGVLMGTAYVCTDEAVACGAVVPGYQQAVLACDRTVLLETSPGHATRCAVTPYVEAFAAERARLEAQGTDPQQLWATLEAMNLGRLRMASKGVARRGGRLVPLPPDEQARQGMVMVGQVAALCERTVPVAELHREVSEGSSAVLEALGDEPRTWRVPGRGRRPSPASVAVIGMAAVFPGAPDVERFWANVVAGVDAVREVPPERWDPAQYFDPGAVSTGAGRKTPSKWGGFVPPVAFDALAYGIPPRSLAAIEPVQLLSLHVAAQALADAGYGPDAERELDRSRVSVVFGAEAGTDLAGAYGFRALAPQYLGGLPPDLDGILPELTEDSFPGVLANVIAGRIANRLDLGGVNYTVDAACASSLAALDAAVKELRAGTSDVVLCGGADLHNGIADFLLFSAVHALSPSGRCASFDASADGIALGEGVACLVLKRLEDARRDGNRVYAVVDAVAGASDGRSLGLTAPRPEGQRLALQRAYEQAGLSPADVGLLEAHGTGTVVGDRTELGVLSELFTDSGAPPGSCVLGSVKSQIGHTKCAAGLAGLIKVVRAVHAGVLPPTIHLQSPNPAYDPATSPFVFVAQACPWASGRRVAGVSAFGFGGTNFHAVVRTPDDLEVEATAGSDAAAESDAAAGSDAAAASDTDSASGHHGGSRGSERYGQRPVDGHRPRHGLSYWPAELVVVRGPDRQRAVELLERIDYWAAALGGRVAPVPGALRDLAAAAWVQGRGPVRAAIVARDVADLRAKVAEALAALEAGRHLASGTGVVVVPDGPPPPPRVALLFPGQGSQRPGMLGELFVTFPPLQRHLQAAPEVAAAMFPPAAFDPATRRAQVADLTDTTRAQPALGMAGLAAAELLRELGVRPHATAGHSYGELAALAAAGALDAWQLVPLSQARAAAMAHAAAADPGAMAAVAADAEAVRRVLDTVPGVVVANDNGPDQVVVSGPTPAMAQALAALGAAGIAAKRLPVACAFHSPVVAAGAQQFAAVLEEVTIRTPAVAVWSNVTAAAHEPDPAAIRARLAEQIASPVRFREQIEDMAAAGISVFVEVGPGGVLTGLVRRILAGRPHVAVSVDPRGDGTVAGLLLALAELAGAGVALELGVLFDGRGAPVDLAADPPPPAGWVVDGHLVRTADGKPVPGSLPAPADLARAQVLAAGAAGSSTAPARGAGVPRTGLPHATVPQAGDGASAGAPAATGDTASGSGANGASVTDSSWPPAESSAVPAAAGDRVRGVDPAASSWQDGGVGSGHGGGSEAVVLDYLRTVREALAASREVVLRHLGVAPWFGAAASAAAGDTATGAAAVTSVVESAARDGDRPPAAADPPEVPGAVAQRTAPPPAAAGAGTAAVIGDGGTTADAIDADARAATGDASREPASEVSVEALRAAVLAVVSERTGYPLDMLEPTLDLEADLSIDSIKRLEIVSEIADRVGLHGADGAAMDDAAIDELVARKTVEGVVAWLAEALGQHHAQHRAPQCSPVAGTGQTDAVAADAAAVDDPGPVDDHAPVDDPAHARGAADAGDARLDGQPEVPAGALRFVPRLVEVPAPSGTAATVALAGRRIAVSDDGSGLAGALCTRLVAGGASVQLVAGGEPVGPCDEVLVLARRASGPGEAALEVFERCRQGARAGASGIVVVTAAGGDLGMGGTDSALGAAGVRGVVKTVARELPALSVRLVDLASDATAAQAADLVLEELAAGDGLCEVGRQGSVRQVVVMEPSASPAARDTPRDARGAASFELEPGSVVVLTGGARGITARVARALATRGAGTVVLVGRTPEPRSPEPPQLAAAADATGLRRILSASAFGPPAAIEAEAHRVLATREVRTTVEELRALGAIVDYRCADLSHRSALRALLDDVRARYGRVDGLVHGAGIVEDALATDKSPESFRRVFWTKMAGALDLVDAVRSAPVDGGDRRLEPWQGGFVVLFSSVAGVFGNRGQVDYAAANDALAAVARWLARRCAGRVLAVHWGPWAGGGMVGAELGRAFGRRGVGLLDPDDAVERLLDELGGAVDGPEVVLVRARPEAFGWVDPVPAGTGESSPAGPDAVAADRTGRGLDAMPSVAVAEGRDG